MGNLVYTFNKEPYCTFRLWHCEHFAFAYCCTPHVYKMRTTVSTATRKILQAQFPPISLRNSWYRGGQIVNLLASQRKSECADVQSDVLKSGSWGKWDNIWRARLLVTWRETKEILRLDEIFTNIVFFHRLDRTKSQQVFCRTFWIRHAVFRPQIAREIYYSSLASMFTFSWHVHLRSEVSFGLRFRTSSVD